MSEPEEFNLEILVQTARQLGPNERLQFLQLLPPETRDAITRTLERLEKSSGRPTVEISPEEHFPSAATLIVDKTQCGDVESDQSDGSVPSDEHLELQNLDEVSSRTVVDYLDTDSLSVEVPNVDRKRVPDSRIAGGVGGNDQQRSGVHLVKLHARGAVGEVFVAYDERLSRQVAIKRIRPELPTNKRRQRRFLREAVITAKLQHPGIVPIYTMGDANGSPHYTMPLVSGSTMAEVIQQTHDGIKRTTSPQKWMSAMRPLLRNFIAACYAIDYAHTENIVHRDLKPSNILIGSRGRTMVVDWGCAKDIDESEVKDGSLPSDQDDNEDQDDVEDQDDDDGDQGGGSSFKISDLDLTKSNFVGDITMSGSVMGTVEFMSPEQAAGDNESVGKLSDVFGLGATLFCLLTNERAIDFDNEGEVREALAKVKQGQFRRIDEIDHRVPKNIIAVCQRAMAFKPEDRYATPGELGRDVEAFLDGDIVQAYEEPLYDRMMRFTRRHKTAFTTLVGILLVGLMSMTVLNLVVNNKNAGLAFLNNQLTGLNDQLTESVDTERELRAEAVHREDLIIEQLYGNQMLLASEASTEAGGLGRMRELVGNWTDHDGQDFEALRGWEWSHLKNLGSRELWTSNENITASQIVTTRESRFAKVFDRAKQCILTVDLDDQKVTHRKNLNSDCSAVDFNRDQTRIAQGHNDGRVTVGNWSEDSNNGSLGESRSASLTAEHHEHKSKVIDVQWNIGGDLLASADEKGNVIIWHAGDQELVARGENALSAATDSVLAWSYDGHQLFWTTGSKLMRVDVQTLEQEEVLSDGWITHPCNSHEGELLAYIGPEDTIVVAEVGGKILHRFEGHQLFVESLHWHPTKHLLLSSSADGTVRIWDADTKKEIRQLLGHEGHVYSAAWNTQGTRVISGGLPEDDLRLWDVSDIGVEAFDRELQDRPAAAWHRSGDSLVIAEGADLLIQTTEGDSRWLRAADPSAPTVFGVDFHPREDVIACVSSRGKVWTVDAKSGEVKAVYDAGSDSYLYPEITSRGVQWSPDGKYLAAVGGDGSLRVWSFADQRLVSASAKSGRVMSVAWSPISAAGQQRVAAVGTEDQFIIFDPESEKTVQRIVLHGWKTGLAWSPDGEQLAVSDKRSVRIWNAADGAFVGVCDGPVSIVLDLDWSSSQNRFAALTEDGKICIWDSQARTYLARFALHSRAPYCIRWSPDGKRLVSTARFGRIVFQDIE